MIRHWRYDPRQHRFEFWVLTYSPAECIFIPGKGWLDYTPESWRREGWVVFEAACQSDGAALMDFERNWTGEPLLCYKTASANQAALRRFQEEIRWPISRRARSAVNG